MIEKKVLTPKYDEVEKKLGYKFSNRELLETALTHTTHANTYGGESNQRLEFLGDAVLGVVVAEFLYRNFSEREGVLSKMRSRLVDEENLSKLIDKMGLKTHLRVSEGSAHELQNLHSVKADLFEAILGAIFLDSNFHTASGWCLNKLGIDKNNAKKKIVATKDYKSLLQEAMQQQGKKVVYKLIKQEGKPHEREYTIQISVDGVLGATATNTSKKLAEMEVAKKTLKDKGLLWVLKDWKLVVLNHLQTN